MGDNSHELTQILRELKAQSKILNDLVASVDNVERAVWESAPEQK